MTIGLVEISMETKKKIQQIIQVNGETKILRFVDPELEKEYDAFLVETTGERSVLKKAEENEVAANQRLASAGKDFAVPKLKQAFNHQGQDWLLTEYVTGSDLQVLNQNGAVAVGEALSRIHSSFYTTNELPVHEGAKKLLNKLPNNSALATAYLNYLERLASIPQTFIHDDFLPINVVSDGVKTIIIDWGYGRMGSYMTDVARFYAFYSPSRETAGKGLTFLDDGNYVEMFLESYYENLTAGLAKELTKEQFEQDLQLEVLHQYLLNISHLKTINPQTISSEWETFFYQKAIDQASRLLNPSSNNKNIM